ncbi:unnamed protein product [Vitrella brassicaformis CCMP3155]|uniref:phosphoserine phosphatase n=2 Tax=Vitrella brassicaformis TaxID=1169539 RepID=A0A0G4EWJ0_VITBC|nr:unnamed protein product [Vitrella brassicaformis CCMP3155]|eukprot:CEM02419.1 unnamed protein product [Vitrella brassicaformis CCMP3155]
MAVRRRALLRIVVFILILASASLARSRRLLSAASTTARHMSAALATATSSCPPDEQSAGALCASHRSAAPCRIDSAKSALRDADIVCFDVDSTVLTYEAIDEFATYLDKSEGVAALTREAMEGGMKYEDALERRLQLMQPTRADVEGFINTHDIKLSSGIEQVVSLLQRRGTAVYLVSGGFRFLLEPLADALKIPRTNIYANELYFDTHGNYAGFDRSAPTSRDGGKAEAVAAIIQGNNTSAHNTANKGSGKGLNVVMVGDGATDLQARPPASVFIGYGGVSVRKAVKEGADWFVTDFTELIDVLRG